VEIVATAMTGQSLYVDEGFALIGCGLGMTGFLELRGNSNLDGLCRFRSETDGELFPELVFARLLRVWISSKSPVAGQSRYKVLETGSLGSQRVLCFLSSATQDRSSETSLKSAWRPVVRPVRSACRTRPSNARTYAQRRILRNSFPVVGLQPPRKWARQKESNTTWCLCITGTGKRSQLLSLFLFHSELPLGTRLARFVQIPW
jgi:hypothetical protein